ncbi:YraN family protein [Panacibacter ginsenosidivorans]|uniref:UPF0102 protein FRZ67_15550 n=1 Tax=Panacibacter ginsenosidivorans TaxID=1813871 RepID=A0A5B8VCC6_9BACT|nr:YraN family protein [Panacibacter ginsenosidivorans]QEC68653.1 YraN family protein [Panacibacter ginsenosidivorans]
MSYNKQTGNKGEDMAAVWIQQKGYSIIERNWRFKHWEVDIIASKENKLHFFEVKTRTSAKFGHPEESIGKIKMQSLINAAMEYQYLHPEWKLLQFDVLSITMIRGTPTEYFLIEDVFF